jgi:hypothetical protein
MPDALVSTARRISFLGKSSLSLRSVKATKTTTIAIKSHKNQNCIIFSPQEQYAYQSTKSGKASIISPLRTNGTNGIPLGAGPPTFFIPM